ncbi:SCO-spondin-like [Branchiostoma floridae x Branchiostoma belcheri]
MRICVFLLVALIIASPALCRKSKNKLKCDPLDLENVDCTECYDKNGDPVPVPTPPNGYKRKTTCHCKCDFGCVRDIGAPTRECRYRSGKPWKGGRGLTCNCRQCDPPTIPPTYVSSNCSELTEYPAGTICLYECPPGCPAPPEENRRQYCGNGRWRWNPRICPPCNGSWSDWVNGTCSVTCGVGAINQTRTCDNPAPSNGGADCTREDGTTGLEEQRTLTCTLPPCPIVGGWSDWVDDGPCSATCGDGMISQSRTCNNPSPAYGGADCTLEDGVTTGLTESRTVPCNIPPCPIDGGWSEWVEGVCSVTCGVGEKTRTRNCNNPSPAHGGAECTLEDGTTGLEETKIIPCDEGPCPIGKLFLIPCKFNVTSFHHNANFCSYKVSKWNHNGGWSEWVEGACSVTCGVGEKTRTRNCNNPSPAHGGAECTLEDGTTGLEETKIIPCDEGPCPIDGGWSEWVEGECSVTCGVGEKTRTRNCNNPSPAHGGAECTLEDGVTTGLEETKIIPCDEGPCPIDGGWSEWVEGECSVTCGVGEKTRTRNCNNPSPAHGGAECTLEDGTTGLEETKIISCDEGPCPIGKLFLIPCKFNVTSFHHNANFCSYKVSKWRVDGGWSEWVEGECSVTCGVGEKTRTRNCNNPSPAHGGAECTLEDGVTTGLEETKIIPCDEGPCPIDGGWSEWVEGECSVTCGVGEKTRTRNCNNPSPAHGGAECTLEDGVTTGLEETKIIPCDEGPCPIDGGWSEWVEGECSVTCGVGEKTRTRNCNNPSPAHGGAECTLEDGVTTGLEETKIIPCDEGPCPIDGGWSEWVEGECSVTCGVGEKTRTRNCNNPSPAHGGAECTLEDGVTTGLEETKIIPCDEGPCPIDGGWSEWVEGECSVTCGVGEKTRTRNCNNPSPAHGGAECTLEDGVTTGLEETNIIPCDEGPCPIGKLFLIPCKFNVTSFHHNANFCSYKVSKWNHN